MSPAVAPPARPAGRYGDAVSPRRRRVGLALIAVGAGAALAYLLWAGLYHATPPVRGGLVGYEVTDRSATVRVEVIKEADATAVCRVRAQDSDHVTVGSAEARVGPPEHGERSVVEIVVPTTARPVNGELRGCVLADRPRALAGGSW